MPTPRKKLPNTPFGLRVQEDVAKGRTLLGTEFGTALAERVKAIRKRCNAPPAVLLPEWQRVTRRDFAERIGLSEDALADRLRTAAPTQFSAQELALICLEFRVCAEYLLLGEGPMMRADAVAASADGSLPLSFRRHVAAMMEVRLDQDSEWLASYLPEPDDLLQAVELGVEDAVSAGVELGLTNRARANAAIRESVRMSTQPIIPTTDTPDDFFKPTIQGLRDGTVILPDPGDR